MDIEYEDLNDKYLILVVKSGNEKKYGIVDKRTGEEYISPVCKSIIYHRHCKLIEFSFNNCTALWRIEDLDKYVGFNKNDSYQEDLPF